MPRPPLVHRAADLSWRYLVIIAAVTVTFYAVGFVKVVVIPLILAFFVASVLSPPVMWFRRLGLPPLAATWAVIALVIPLFVGFMLLLVPAFGEGLGPLGDDLEQAVNSFVVWLSDGPLQLSDAEVQDYIDGALDAMRSNLGGLTAGLVGGATIAIEVVTGFLLTLLASFFYLKDGDRAYAAFLRRVPRPERVRASVEAAWSTLSAYVRGLAIVGFADALFIGIGLWIVGVPLVLPLSVLVFIGGFFPIIGAFLSGLVAVSVAFVNGGLTDALIVFAIVLGVQQVESNLLHPIVFRRVMSIHPLVILMSIAIGGVGFGIVGAFFAVPLTATVLAAHKALSDDPDASMAALLRSPVYYDGDPLAVDEPPKSEAEPLS